MKIKVCLHNHTIASKYALNTKEDFSKAFDEGKIDKIAITDHDHIHTAKEYQKFFGEDKIILGEEITTKDGDIIGLFLKKFVTSGLSAERTIDLIKVQGGLVYIPHPFGKKGIGETLINHLKNKIDVFEIFNSWEHWGLAKPLHFKDTNRIAEKYAEENNLHGFSSSDSHFRTNIGKAYTLMNDFTNKEEFLESLSQGLEFKKEKSRGNLLGVRALIKGRLNRDILSFVN